jgi:hypothetical protein
VTELADATRSVRTTGCGGHFGEWLDITRHQVDHRSFPLQFAVHQEECVSSNHAP